MDAEVTDNPGQHRFEMALGPDAIAAACYRVDGDGSSSSALAARKSGVSNPSMKRS
jgi:hypothetical protein